MKTETNEYTLDQVIDLCSWDKNHIAFKHITFNPNLTKENEAQYEIRMQSRHDGTLIFTLELISEALLKLINKKTVFKPFEKESNKSKDVSYEIGKISVTSKYGMVDLPVGKINGVTELIIIPVKSTLIF